MVNVYLGGKLGRLFGEKWSLALNMGTPHEAIHAINVNTRGAFKRYLGAEGKSRYYQVGIGAPEKTIEAKELTHRSGSSDIYITPVVGGRNSGAAKIIAGVIILAVVTYFTLGTGDEAVVAGAGGDFGGETVAASPSIFAAGGAVGNIALSVGVSLVLGGISQLLSPHQQQGGELGSNYFQGAASAGLQGGCVPVVYGLALVSPITISIWFNNVDYNTSQNTYLGTLETAQIPGGGTEFTPAGTVANQGNTSS